MYVFVDWVVLVRLRNAHALNSVSKHEPSELPRALSVFWANLLNILRLHMYCMYMYFVLFVGAAELG